MKKRLPKFKTEKQEAEFWDKHSPLDYFDGMEEIETPFEFNPKILAEAAKATEEAKKMIALRIEPTQVDLAKIIAKNKGRGYQSLFRVWIKAGIQKELHSHPELVKKLRKKEMSHKKD
ncbi:MAG: CopG family antitoxin [Candidatus Omnitrophota bacterium]